MVQYPHIDQLQRVLKPLGEHSVGLAGLGAAGGVVVAQDHGSGVVGQGALDHLPGVDTGAGDGATKKRFERQHLMPRIEKQAAKNLMRFVAQHRLEIVTNSLRVFQHRILPSPRRQMSPAHFENRAQLSEFRRAEPHMAVERDLICLKQRPQAAKLGQQMSCQIHRAFTRHTRA